MHDPAAKEGVLLLGGYLVVAFVVMLVLEYRDRRKALEAGDRPSKWEKSPALAFLWGPFIPTWIIYKVVSTIYHFIDTRMDRRLEHIKIRKALGGK